MASLTFHWETLVCLSPFPEEEVSAGETVEEVDCTPVSLSGFYSVHKDLGPSYKETEALVHQTPLSRLSGLFVARDI